MIDLLDLPQEILANILSFLNPHSLARFGQSCKTAHSIVDPGNQLLWRSAYLHVFDDPGDASSMMPGGADRPGPHEQWSWHDELSRRFSALAAVHSSKWCGLNSNAGTHVSALLNILDTAKFTPTAQDLARGKTAREDDRTISLNLQLLAKLVADERDGLESLIHDCPSEGDSPRRARPYPHTRSVTVSEAEKNRSAQAARLHVMYGLTNREHIEHKARGSARRKVYDWSLTGPENDYAPFLRDRSGGIDWPLLEAIVSVISRNFTMCVEGQVTMPQGFHFSIPHRTLKDPTTPAADWARVTGPWWGTYSFLDYADLFTFNNWEEVALGARPTLDDEPEDCGDLMKLELHLDDSLAGDPRLKTDLPACTDLPVLYFSGLSRGQAGFHRPAIGVRGTASLVPGGREVRWRFLIRYGGQDQWQLEGVQPGGVRSGGIFGIWTQCDHEVNGPVGPFCYFPVELCKPTSVVLVS